MRFGGFQELSLIDYPGKVAATVFTIGCSFRCPFCYNPGLVDGTIKEIPENHILSLLEKRRKILDAVVICGGEPPLHADLPEFCAKLKKLGFSVKLDTNGSNPVMLRKLVDEKLVDCIAMDIKTSFAKYGEASGIKADAENIKKSISIVKSLSDYEFRTTCVPGLVEESDLLEIAEYLKKNKANKAFFIQQFRNKNLLSKALEKAAPYSEENLESFRKKLAPFFDRVEVRK